LVYLQRLTVLFICDSVGVYSLRFSSEMVSGFKLSRNTGYGVMFSCHFSFLLEKFRDNHFINPSPIPFRLFSNLSFTTYHRVGFVYFTSFCVVKKFYSTSVNFSLLFVLIVFYERVDAFLFSVFLLLYTVPCSRATSLSMNCELINLSRKLWKSGRFVKTVHASIF